MFKVKEGYEGDECGWASEEAFNKAFIIWNDSFVLSLALSLNTPRVIRLPSSSGMIALKVWN